LFTLIHTNFESKRAGNLPSNLKNPLAPNTK